MLTFLWYDYVQQHESQKSLAPCITLSNRPSVPPWSVLSQARQTVLSASLRSRTTRKSRACFPVCSLLTCRATVKEAQSERGRTRFFSENRRAPPASLRHGRCTVTQCSLLGPLVLRSLKLSRLTQNMSSDPEGKKSICFKLRAEFWSIKYIIIFKAKNDLKLKDLSQTSSPLWKLALVKKVRKSSCQIHS